MWCHHEAVSAKSGSWRPDLPNTRDEVVAASRALGWQSTLLLGRDVTEAAVKLLSLGSFDIIHIATHGVSSAEFSDRAALVLAPDSMTGEDGLLQVREIRETANPRRVGGLVSLRHRSRDLTRSRGHRQLGARLLICRRRVGGC